MKWFRLTPQLDGGLTDEEAMRRVRLAGDPAAFAQLVGRWEAKVRRLCVRMTGDEHRGEDLAQEAFARVFANRHRYADGKRFSTWLWRIALNLCFEEGRRAKRRAEGAIEPGARAADAAAGAASAAASPDEQVIGRERVDLVRAAVAALPETLRVVVLLREYEGMTCREIAEVLEIPEGTVKWRMADALSKLSRQLCHLAPDETDRGVIKP